MSNQAEDKKHSIGKAAKGRRRTFEMTLRFLDVALAIAGLILLFPFFAVVAVAIRWDSPGPVLFRHRRIGRGFKPFEILKFRTMARNAQQLGGSLTVQGDSRITRTGRLLRKTKIDELPQLLNVLKGDMSLVGPRPEVPEYVEMFRDDYETILSVRPGITDLASIVYREESALLAACEDPKGAYVSSILPEKIRLAKEYVAHRSLALYFGLIVRTLFAVVSQHKPARQIAPTAGAHDLATGAGEDQNATTY